MCQLSLIDGFMVISFIKLFFLLFSHFSVVNGNSKLHKELLISRVTLAGEVLVTVPLCHLEGRILPPTQQLLRVERRSAMQSWSHCGPNPLVIHKCNDKAVYFWAPFACFASITLPNASYSA